MCRNTGTSARGCVVIALLALVGALAPTANAARRSLVSSWDAQVSRDLLDAPADVASEIVEELADACDLPGSLDAFFSQGGQGEVCQLAASVIGRGTQRFYTFEVPLNLTNLSFQVSLKNLEGEAIVYVLLPTSPPRPRVSISVLAGTIAHLPTRCCLKYATVSSSVEYDTQGDGWANVELEEWASGSSLIYLADGLEPARTRVVLESKAIVSTFSLRIEFFRGGTQVSEEALQVRSQHMHLQHPYP